MLSRIPNDTMDAPPCRHFDFDFCREKAPFMSDFDQYDNPLIGRYASAEMSAIWSPQRKHSTWRRLWVALAESERELGLDISPAQIDQLRAAVDNVDSAKAAEYERSLR